MKGEYNSVYQEDLQVKYYIMIQYSSVSLIRNSEILWNPKVFFERQDDMSGRLWEGCWGFTPDVVFNLIVTSYAMFSVTRPAVK
jgi:hypothetical protein